MKRHGTMFSQFASRAALQAVKGLQKAAVQVRSAAHRLAAKINLGLAAKTISLFCLAGAGR
jgi:hypothetical protein